MSHNPYCQVALTYLRRPFASWPVRLASVFVLFMFIALALIGRAGTLKDAVFVQLIYFLFFFVFLALHIKRQFVDPPVRLMPGYRRVHAAVAAFVALMVAGVLPALLAWFMGWHCMGFVAVVALLFGVALWVVAADASWTLFALLFGWWAVCSTEWGTTWLRELVSGQIELQAAAILVLGIAVTLLAGIRLVRLDEDALTYDSALHWDWDWSQKTRQGSSGDGRILAGLRDWITEREMVRLARLACHASERWWARTCRWQLGMVAGPRLWFWILGVLIYFQIVGWWIMARTPRQPMAMMALTSLVLTFVPAMITAVGAFQWRTFKLGRESLLPVERNRYIRQLGAAAALSHFQLWGGMSAALALWWLLVGPRPLPFALFGGVLILSAAVQVAIFGVVVWVARYRSLLPAVFLLFSVLFSMFFAAQLSRVRHMRDWSVWSTGQMPSEVLWPAAVVALCGLAIAYDAYRRWLAADLG